MHALSRLRQQSILLSRNIPGIDRNPKQLLFTLRTLTERKVSASDNGGLLRFANSKMSGCGNLASGSPVSDLSLSSVKPMHTSIILDNNTCGFLRRQGYSTIGPGLHRKRFYRLDGSVLSKQAAETSPATWHGNVLGAEVAQHSKLCLSVSLKETSTESDDDSRLLLHAKTESSCQRWVQCLQNAASRSLEQHYRIGEVIGEGGFASVRLGQCRETQRVVAVKTIGKEQEYMQLYGREIAVIKKVDHSNIVRTFDLYETDKKIHIVMEYMSGGMLFEAIEDGIAFTEADVAQLMREILHGVTYLHDNGIVHRDLKPENVLCTDSHPPWHVKIADFGLSKFTQNGAPSTDMLMKTMIGTPEFIAPEIAKGDNYTSKVDVWAVGMLMYNVVTGKLPFDENEQDFIGKLRSGLQLTFPEEQWLHYSPDARLFTKALLCPDPDKRLTALGALVHPWLDNELRFGSSRFSAHGRFSRVPAPLPDFDIPTIGKVGGRKSYLFGAKSPKKPSWVVAFIAVQAMNRFRRLVRSHAPLSLLVDGSAGERKPKEKKASRLSGTTTASDMDFSDDDVWELSPTSVRGYTNESLHSEQRRHSSFENGTCTGARNLKSIMTSMSQNSKHAAAAIPATPSRGNNSARLLGVGPRAASGLLAGPLRKASGLISANGPARKGSGLSSLLGKTKDAASPVRKGSFRALFKSGTGNDNDGMHATAAVAEFDQMLGLGDLGVETVDDEDNEIGFDSNHGLKSDGPASLFGAKHMRMMQAGKVPAALSPLAPASLRRPSTSARGGASFGYKSRLQEVSSLGRGPSMTKRGKGAAWNGGSATGTPSPLGRLHNQSNNSFSSYFGQ